MSGDGEERTARRSAGHAEAASGTPDDDLALADLTAGGPSPLEDLGAPWEGPAPGSALPDLTGGAVGGPAAADRLSVEGDASAAADDDWSPAPPLAGSDGPATDAIAGPAESPAAGADGDWAPLPDLVRRGPRSGRPRRGGRPGGASPRSRRGVRDGDPSSAEPHDGAHGRETGDGVAADDVARPAAVPAVPPVPTGPEGDAPPIRGDGLPPGALGAGAAGVGQLFGDGEAAGGAPGHEHAGRGRRKGRRRGKRGAAGSDGEATPGEESTATDRPLTAEQRLQHALTLAYRHLSKRDRTVSEVRAHLKKREIDEVSIAGALKELTDFGYVDDERYATRFVEDKRRLEGWGHLRIEQGLRRTGIPREVADRALADDPLRGDEDELAVEALEQRLAGRPLEDDRARQKALRLLATKGYALETSYAAVRAYERRCAERADD